MWTWVGKRVCTDAVILLRALLGPVCEGVAPRVGSKMSIPDELKATRSFVDRKSAPLCLGGVDRRS